jgi:hypothetical protein
MHEERGEDYFLIDDNQDKKKNANAGKTIGEGGVGGNLGNTTNPQIYPKFGNNLRTLIPLSHGSTCFTRANVLRRRKGTDIIIYIRVL